MVDGKPQWRELVDNNLPTALAHRWDCFSEFLCQGRKLYETEGSILPWRILGNKRN